jgi:hypothetical protein
MSEHLFLVSYLLNNQPMHEELHSAEERMSVVHALAALEAKHSGQTPHPFAGSGAVKKSRLLRGFADIPPLRLLAECHRRPRFFGCIHRLDSGSIVAESFTYRLFTLRAIMLGCRFPSTQFANVKTATCLLCFAAR